MSKPKIKDSRRAYVLDIILRFEPEHKTGIPQKRITKRVLVENINYKIKTKDIKKDHNVDYKDQKLEIKRKVNIAVSKTINSLERDGIITVTSPRVPGKRGANPNIISLNKTPEALYKILKCYEGNLLGEGIWGDRFSLPLKYNLLISNYYKDLVNEDLVNELTKLSELPFTDEDKELIYYLISSSPEALTSLFYQAYERGSYINYNKHKSEALNETMQKIYALDGGERFKRGFIEEIQTDFIKTVFTHHNLPKFSIEAGIEVKFKDNKGKLVYTFSNKSTADLEDSQIIYPYGGFI